MKKLFTLLFFLTFLSKIAFAKDYQLSTHILDINKGLPASNVEIILYKYNAKENNWLELAKNKTDKNGRINNLLPIIEKENNHGRYKLKFEVDSYYKSQSVQSIYPYIEIIFDIQDNNHYHIPLAISGNGYSTYKGN